MLNEIISSNKEVMGGEPVFVGTRVPIKALFDYLESGKSLEMFLEDFPTVKSTQANGLLHLAHQLLLSFNEKTAA